MDHWIDDSWQSLRYGETLLACGVDNLAQGLKSSTEAIGKLWTEGSKLCTGGAERWQRAIRQMQTPVNLADILPPSLADILRARTSS